MPSMWNFQSEELPDHRGMRFFIPGRTPTFADVLSAWQTDAAFRTEFNALLARAPFTAFCWETPSVTASTITRPFEFVLLDDPWLARQPDAEAFAEYFPNATEVVEFTNLRKDAILIVPCPIIKHSAYGHLAAFIREAPESQQSALWQKVGDAMSRRIGIRPVWLSTAGAGVSWLHVRLDDRPKYYGHEPYRQKPA